MNLTLPWSTGQKQGTILDRTVRNNSGRSELSECWSTVVSVKDENWKQTQRMYLSSLTETSPCKIPVKVEVVVGPIPWEGLSLNVFSPSPTSDLHLRKPVQSDICVPILHSVYLSVRSHETYVRSHGVYIRSHGAYRRPISCVESFRFTP